MIKQKDPRIYDKNTKFYSSSSSEEESDDDDDDDKKENKKHKPKKLKDIVREQILEKIEKEEISGESDEDENENIEPIKTYQEEQDELKNEFLKAAKEIDNTEDDDDILVKKKKKTKLHFNDSDEEGDADSEEEDDEEEKFEKYIEKSDIKDKELIKKFINENPENEYDKFLHDYIKKREWRLDNDSDNETSNFIKNKSKKINSNEKEKEENGEEENDEDEEFDDQNDRYELYYNNYRFNEEGGDQIISYARNIEGSLRRKKDKRKKERDLKKEREYNERKRKEEELKRLKNLKKQEIANKIKELELMAGKIPSSEVDDKTNTFTEKDIDGDFNPEEYDKRMNEIFNNDYYNKVDEETKPEIDDLLSDNEKELLLEGEEEGDYAPEPEVIDDEDDDGDKKKKKKKKNKKNQKNKEDEFEEEEIGEEGEIKEYDSKAPKLTEEELKAEKEKLLDELYGLDYEDTIGDLHTRFKYHKVQPLHPGISTNELLLANDKELKQYMSVKKIAAYREKNARINSKKRREFRQQLKERLEKEGYKLDDDGNLIEVPVSVMNEVLNKKKKKRKHDNNGRGMGGDDDKKKHKKKKTMKTMIPRGRLATYGL